MKTFKIGEDQIEAHRYSDSVPDNVVGVMYVYYDAAKVGDLIYRLRADGDEPYAIITGSSTADLLIPVHLADLDYNATREIAKQPDVVTVWNTTAYYSDELLAAQATLTYS